MNKILIVIGIVAAVGLFIALGSDGNDAADLDMTGLHIMPDGVVMNGAGDEIRGVRILEDGQIELPNSNIVTPTADYRK